MQFRPILTIAAMLFLSGAMLARASAQTPTASPVASPAAGGWQVTETREIDVEGEPVALSPDGRWLAGADAEGDSICVWDVESLTPTCTGDGLVIAPFPLTPAFVWAPDSSAVAFIDGAAQIAGARPTDVMLFDVASGNLSRLTTTAPDDGAIHIGTAWTADSKRVVFSSLAGIAWIDRTTGEMGHIPLDDWDTDVLISWPVFIMVDDSVIFRVDRADAAEEIEGVWQVDLDGANLTQVVASDALAPSQFPVPLSVSPDGHHVSVASMEAVRKLDWPNAYYLVDARTGEVAHLEIAGRRNVTGPPVFSPDSEYALVAGGDAPDSGVYVLDLATGDAQPLSGVGASTAWFSTPPTWAANDTAFIPSDDGGILITLVRAT